MKKSVKFFVAWFCILFSLNIIGCSSSKKDANTEDSSSKYGTNDEKKNDVNILTVGIRDELIDLYTDLDEEYISQKRNKDTDEWKEFKIDFQEEIDDLSKKSKEENYSKAQEKIEELFNEYQKSLDGNEDKSKINTLKKEIQSLLK